MVWGYLSEFWNSITETVVSTLGDSITYTVEFFQSIGNAVAGAIGSLFDDLIHHTYDVFLVTYWLFDQVTNAFAVAFTPLYWVFSFSKGFLASATASLEELGIAVDEFVIYTEIVEDFFDAIPYFSYLLAGGGALIGLFFVILIIKKASVM